VKGGFEIVFRGETISKNGFVVSFKRNELSRAFLLSLALLM